ncbi:16S rRNA (cytosine(967)-C(5))-methyltransferase RsmB [Enterococcus massiliensis]|uniref:16S rRNA (cytosine(967)-C(5))-methyltransferase RsmB n=1 Tax=Enterococcus massiliensis TaxID=1640685 RepID=UPI00065E8259|nr:16S rRNA (cytosine(967)-C(5))-methyltransferase RsmB [Enterococcus massiliensis]
MARTPKVKRSVRYTALQILERVEKGGAYSNLLINEGIKNGRLNEKDGRLLTELVYGTISRQLLLDFYLKKFIKDAKKVEPWVQRLLRLSLYQMLYLDKVPSHAILNEAVEIAKAKGSVGVSKFINAVLRNVQRQGVADISEISDPIQRLATEISMPKCLTQKFVAQLGEEETRRLGLSLFTPSHVSARVDLRRISREAVLENLAEEEINAKNSVVSPYGVVAEKGYLAGSTLFHEGLLTAQDESSMLVAPALQLQPHHKVLDACAAPGGKTTHIATFLEHEQGGEVIALDIHQHKVQLIEENAQRLGVDDVVVGEKMDARQAHEQFPPESFDRILVDAPCSGLGLMRRKPDIKYHKKPEDFLQLQKIQLAILASVSGTLKRNGILVYSTCTVTEEENQQVVAKFLADHPEFESIPVAVNELVGETLQENLLTIYPQQFMTDGFFISCLRKK